MAGVADVDDCQSSHAQSRTLILVNAFVIGAAMVHGMHHRHDIGLRIPPPNAADTAHIACGPSDVCNAGGTARLRLPAFAVSHAQKRTQGPRQRLQPAGYQAVKRRLIHFRRGLH